MLVVLEGIDGSGKGTQAALLLTALRERGFSAEKFSFPRYNTGPFSQAIADYLNGKFGSLSTVAPQLSALLYAGDRYAAKPELDAALAAHDVVVCDRYAASNLAHQGSRLPDDQRPEFVRWLSEIEYDVYGIPQADLTIHLDIPVEVSAALVQKKDPRAYTEAKADLHERDLEYLHRSLGVYRHLAAHHVGGAWITIPCTTPNARAAGGGDVRGIPDIHADVCQAVFARLKSPQRAAV